MPSQEQVHVLSVTSIFKGIYKTKDMANTYMLHGGWFLLRKGITKQLQEVFNCNTLSELHTHFQVPHTAGKRNCRHSGIEWGKYIVNEAQILFSRCVFALLLAPAYPCR